MPLALAGIVAALASDADDRDMRASTATGGGSTGRRVESSSAVGGGSGHDVDPLTGRPRGETR